MSMYRSKNRTICAKVETAPRTPIVPSASADAIKVADPVMGSGLEVFNPNEVSASLDRSAPIPIGGTQPFTCTAYLKGSGTGSIAPEIDALLRGCTLAATVTASAVTGTAAGGSSTTVQLANGASAVDHFYVGMPVRITAGAGTGQERTIIAYVGSTRTATVGIPWSPSPDGTSTYSIPANVRYLPQSSVEETITLRDYWHRSDGGQSKLYEMSASAGTFNLQLTPRGTAQLGFNFSGRLNDVADVAVPAAPVYDDTVAPVYRDAQIALGGVSTNVAQLSIDLGGTVAALDDPRQKYGYEGHAVSERAQSGSLTIPKGLESAQDFMASWRDSTPMSLAIRFGSIDGNRVAITVPQLSVTARENEDRAGFGFNRVPFQPVARERGFAICTY